MATKEQFQVQVVNGGTFTALIPSGQTNSSALPVIGASIVGIATPSNITACDLSFQVSIDGAEYWPLCDSQGDPVSIPISGSVAIGNLGGLFLGFLYVKAISSVAQAQDTTITFIMRQV